jgi:hypothetical protein
MNSCYFFSQSRVAPFLKTIWILGRYIVNQFVWELIGIPVLNKGYKPSWKMVRNSFEKRNFMQPMGRLSVHSWTVQFFLIFEGGARRVIFCFLIPLFSMCSHWIFVKFSEDSQVNKLCLNMFPKIIPITPQFYPI